MLLPLLGAACCLLLVACGGGGGGGGGDSDLAASNCPSGTSSGCEVVCRTCTDFLPFSFLLQLQQRHNNDIKTLADGQTSILEPGQGATAWLTITYGLPLVGEMRRLATRTATRARQRVRAARD